MFKYFGYLISRRFCIIPAFTLDNLQNMISLNNPLMKSVKVLAVISTLFVFVSCNNEDKLPARALDKPLIFIGLDGAEWNVIKPMIERGELPNIKRLMDAGIHTGLINPGAMVSPPVWSTFVTGEHPRFHGILDHTFPFDGSRSRKPVDSTLRRKPAIWNIASDAGLRSAVLGYYVSWPAEDIIGTIISDRVMQKYPDSVFPESAERSTYKIVNEMTDEDAQEDFLRRFYSWGYRPEQANNPGSSYYKAAKLIVSRADRLLVNDEIIIRSALELQTNAYDLVVLYLRTTDLVSHSFWREYDDSEFEKPADPEVKALLGEAVPEAYRYVDNAIGKLMGKFGEQANYLVVSDHGFHSARKELIIDNAQASVITGNHLPVGVLIAAGPDIRQQLSASIKHYATTLDILPTLMRLLGLPVASSQSGSSLEWLVNAKFKRNNPKKTVLTYPADTFARAYNSAGNVDQNKEMSSLSGLGYIGGEVSEGNVDVQNYDFWSVSDGHFMDHIIGEIIIELLAKRFQNTADIMQEFLTVWPELEKEIYRQLRKRLILISESAYIYKPINHKKLMRKLKEEMNSQESSELLAGQE